MRKILVMLLAAAIVGGSVTGYSAVAKPQPQHIVFETESVQEKKIPCKGGIVRTTELLKGNVKGSGTK